MSEPSSPSAVDVAVAVLRSPDGRVLLCRRPAEARYGGRWEFPGGKLEPGESHLDALRRELREELDVDCVGAELIHTVETRYDDGGRFAVHFYLVEQWNGEPRNLAASELAWVEGDATERYDILEGSRDIFPLLRRADSAAGST
jgi:8-oxo-dGTP diphosphatase